MEPNVEFVVLESRQFPLAELEGIPNIKRAVCPGVPRGTSGRVLYQNSALPVLLRTLRLDTLLATCNVLPLGCPVPSVVVIQSLQYFDHPEAYGLLRRSYLRAAVRYACHHAKRLISVSDVARQELIRLTGVPAGRVAVIHHGVSPEIARYNGDRTPASPPYVLCVATLYRYKNLPRLLEAFARLKLETAMPHRLRIVGGEADVRTAELAFEARRLGIAADVDLVGPLPHSQMAAEYAHASAFVYPSLYETFGLPPLEAMTLGVPVVASRAASIPEVVGNAAELVDPLDPADIARGLSRVLFDYSHAQNLVQLGFVRASEFSWEACARRTFETIKSALA